MAVVEHIHTVQQETEDEGKKRKTGMNIIFKFIACDPSLSAGL